jgi:hypothetical protein
MRLGAPIEIGEDLKSWVDVYINAPSGVIFINHSNGQAACPGCFGTASSLLLINYN